jgi:hypothetical protein
VDVPLGREVYMGVRGSYDFDASMVDEIYYTLRYINDCMEWQLAYKNDRNAGGEDRFEFLLGIRETPLSFGNKQEVDPFKPPEGVKID